MQTFVANGHLVGFVPGVGQIAIPVREILRDAGLGDAEIAEFDDVDSVSGETLIGCLRVAEEVGRSRRAKRKARRKRIFGKVKKAVKKVAKSKLVKGLVNAVAKVVPAPLNAPILAVQGAAKFAQLVKQGTPAKRLRGAVRDAAQGKISSKALIKQAKKLGVSAKLATDAAAVKRLALHAQIDPKAAAAFALAKDLVSTKPADQALALAAAAQAQLGNRGQAFVVQTPNGRVFRTVVTAA